ncbi:MULTISPECIES: GNAT family N-acetyltransferase [Hyphomonas]|uniref:GNAT family N-acetyltransferase n=1 Tax=Hyphomonas adhaerens TaxID=81029 RepID=A0A3B9GZQ1_9PROT|nr:MULTISPECIES: GNAT family N-acetyltransferase [Hyphomonas]MBB39153.1 GNAT family N-acetyltransferase [Hyphomonas sp.]HAE27868.1 GNAT family N-acetyltransferase [Hyphomonas adhaerens]|tara:strand:+ start:1328 stop:1864 length:537 start_codon:yes stop_codon:yes gene_type:complete
MQQIRSEYDIEPALPEDIDRLIEVDLAAGQLFAPTGLLSDDALNDHVPEAVMLQAIEAGDLLKICAPDGTPVGFALVSPRGGTLYLDQISVHPDCGGKGLGTGLMRHVLQLAKQRRLKQVTLSTFRDVPWNGPFYGKLGFREIPRKDMADWMLELERIQAESLDVSQRCFMVRKIGWL